MLEKLDCNTYKLTSVLEGTNSYTLSQIAGGGSSLEEIASGDLFYNNSAEFVISEDGAYVLTFGNTNYLIIVYCTIETGILNLIKELLCSTPCNEKGTPSVKDKKIYYYNAAMLSFQTFLMMINDSYYSNPPYQGEITTSTLTSMFCINKVIEVVKDHLNCAGLLSVEDCGCQPCN